jgi:Fic family protein
MKWVWQLPQWPEYEYESEMLHLQEQQFLHQAGILKGSLKHLHTDENQSIQIEILSQEAIHTSKIEGEILQRDSVQSSIRKHLGLHAGSKKFEPKAFGVSEMMVDVYRHFNEPLDHRIINAWHTKLFHGRRDIENIGSYRTHDEPMQIVSSNLNAPTLYYEAPPSAKIRLEMNRYIKWFHEHLQIKQISILLFASLTHLYFEQIHPFEDGNGRIGRALVEKALSMRLGYPSLASISKTIESNRKKYYTEIQKCNHSLKVSGWIEYFSSTVLSAQQYSIRLIEFVIFKAKFFQKHNDQLNQRQKKVLLRIFEAGPEGFTGGLSAANYQSISKTSTATATRDLVELINLGILEKRGQLKGSRYFLILES